MKRDERCKQSLWEILSNEEQNAWIVCTTECGGNQTHDDSERLWMLNQTFANLLIVFFYWRCFTSMNSR